MPEVELWLMVRRPTTESEVRKVLEPFEAETRTQIRLRLLGWDVAWAELLKVALYQYGPDVAEIGSTWLSSFAGMDALQPLTSFKSAAYGDAAAFLPSCWQSGQLALRPPEPAMTWAVPWWADTRVLYYRRDLLAQAGVDEQGAFDSPDRLAGTLARLQAAGVEIPWVVPSSPSHVTIHNVASWVWGAGGSFVSDDGRRVLFDQPAALSGMRAYLELGRFLAGPARGLDDARSGALYAAGRAAVTISGPWLLRDTPATAEIIEQTGMTLPPGVPFVGGSHLVLWKHAVHETAAVKLIRFLTGREFQQTHGPQAGLLPTRGDVLSAPPFAGNPLYDVVAQGLRCGRSFPTVPLWGLVEEKLSEVLGQMWAELLADRDLDLARVLSGRLERLAHKLNLALRSR